MANKLTLKDCITAAENNGGKCLSEEYKDSHEPMTWECKNGHRWITRFYVIQRGNWCKKCSGISKHTIEDCIKYAKSKNGNCLSASYKDNKTKLIWQCENNHTWEASFHNIKIGNWCKKCSGLERKTIQDCEDLAKSKGGRFLSAEYINSKSTYNWQCKHGHIWATSFHSIRSGTWCPECSRKKKKSINDCHELAKNNNGLCLSEEYKSAHSILIWQCDKGHVFNMRYSNVYSNQWCPTCNTPKRRTLEDAKALAQSKDGECLSKGFVSVDQNLIWKCSNNHTWEATYACVKRSTWCPECSRNKSQKLLKNITEKLLKAKAKYGHRGFAWLKHKKRLEIDIWFPDLKLAIEYDGEQHFVSKKFFGGKRAFNKRQKLDKLKNELIAAHPEDIKYFIRFNYEEPLTEEYVFNKLRALIPQELTNLYHSYPTEQLHAAPTVVLDTLRRPEPTKPDIVAA